MKAFQSTVYLQIRRRWISVRVLTWSGGDFQWEGTAEIFISADAKGRPLVVSGEAARTNPAAIGRFFTAFAHPRAFIDNYEDTFRVISQALIEAGYKGRAKRLMYLVHVRDAWEGGLSDVERRALNQGLHEFCSAGEVKIVDQPYELTPPEVLSIARGKAS
ncbi:MAG TPA: hypothetical protein VK934_07210 [Fimbriimonas sp.]|nr:hypothetical protein [Fimbriimonas sp.]